MLRFLDVACAGLGVGFDKGPVEDALEGWSLRRGLELEPLLHEVLLPHGGKGDAVLGVVLIEDVVHDGARLWGQQVLGYRQGRHRLPRRVGDLCLDLQ